MPEATAAGSSTPARLLLIDRDAATGEALTRRCGAKLMAAEPLVEARTGRQAVDLLKAGAFDIVLADLAEPQRFVSQAG